MASRFRIVATAILALSTSAVADWLGRRDVTSCPSSCLMSMTVTMISNTIVTSTSSATDLGRPTTTDIVIGPTSIPYSSSSPMQASSAYGAASNPIQPSPTDSTVSAPVGPSSIDNTATNGGQATTTPVRTPNQCRHNNCLRQFLRHPQVTAFCATYTATLNTATTDLPDYVSRCHADLTRISSACSCVVTGGANPASATTPAGGNSAPASSSASMNPSSPINPSNSQPPNSVPTTNRQSASSEGLFSTSTRHHQHHSQSTVTIMPTIPGN